MRRRSTPASRALGSPSWPWEICSCVRVSLVLAELLYIINTIRCSYIRVRSRQEYGRTLCREMCSKAGRIKAQTRQDAGFLDCTSNVFQKWKKWRNSAVGTR
ncbi:hypothetical protein BDV97DRAFT_361999 [Delphinella strobiligena]|nr:hypothetical protein BDV97DRAFT_361999 [Delphinella strobiligena]